MSGIAPRCNSAKGKWNILRSCDDNDKMLRERSDRKREEDKVEEDDGCF
jgi:hypothetical protein